MSLENRYDISIECGIDFVLPFTWYDDNDNPMDLTGATVEAQLREYEASPDYFDFSCVHNGSGGRITLTMLHETTEQIGYSYGYYDVHVTLANGTRYRPLYGEVKVYNNITKVSNGEVLFVVSVTKYNDLPRQGNSNRLYLVKETGTFYRWNGSNYTYVGTYNGISSITKIGSSGTEATGIVDTYRITFTSGGHFDFTVKNGKTGKKGDKGDIASPEDIIAQLGDLAFLDNIDYNSNKILNKPDLGELAFLDSVDYRTQVLNTPEPLNVTIDRVRSAFPDVPLPILIALYLANETLYLGTGLVTYNATDEALEFPIVETNGVTFTYIPETETIMVSVDLHYITEDAPADGLFYARRNNAWVAVTSGGGGGGANITYDSVNEALVIIPSEEEES